MFCRNCGNPMDPNAAVCVKCGVPVGSGVNFCPNCGNPYLGYTTKAVIQLIVSLVGGFLTCGVASLGIYIWALIEGIMILTGKIAVDGKGVPLKE